MNKLEGIERMKNSTPFSRWTRLSLDQRLQVVLKEYGDYPLPVSRPVCYLNDLRGMAQDFLTNGRSALITREPPCYVLYSGLVREHCSIIYAQVKSKFKKTPPKDNYVCEIIQKEIFLHNKEYSEMLSKIFDGFKISSFCRTF